MGPEPGAGSVEMAEEPAPEVTPPTERLVVGLQPVREALRVHGPSIRLVMVEDRESTRLQAVVRFAMSRGAMQVVRCPHAKLDRLSRGVSHQGVAAWAPPLQLRPLAPLLDTPELIALAVDGLQDPQNFGATVRSAVGLGAHAFIWAEHASAPLSLATFRASAGAIEHAKLCRVTSLRHALAEATARNVQVVGLDGHASTLLHELNLRAPTVLVVGSEHRGLGRSIRSCCLQLARLAGTTTIDSLSASVAAGIALYAVRIQRVKSMG
jgi:23S rRNA (guanosine2251-2'-O)-methyltransferase